MITGDYQLMFEDYYTGNMITLGGDQAFCSVRFDGIGSAELRASERDMPSEDGIAFGYEYLGKRQWTINGAVKSGSSGYFAGDAGSAWDNLSMLMRAWDYNRARLKAREVVPLYFKRPGREMMIVYGRPERIDPDPSQSHAGYVTYQASFRQSDPKFYSNSSTSTSIHLNQPQSGGLLLNGAKNALLLPFTTAGTIALHDTVGQSGDIESPIVATITGPVNNISLQLLNPDSSVRWIFKLATNVLSGQTVTIDARQWKRSVLRNDGASLAGSYSGPRLGELTVPPGAYEMIYTGSSPDGTSTCTVNLRNAWAAV